MNGLFLRRVLPALLTVAAWTVDAAEKKVVVPVAKLGEAGEIAAVIPGERELLWMLLMNAGFIIWNLVKDYWAAHRRKTDTSAADIQEIKNQLIKFNGAVQSILDDVEDVKKRLEKVPTDKEVELHIYQKVHQIIQSTKGKNG